MRVFITGSAGMLGSSVYPAFHGAGHEVVATDLTPRDVAGLPMGNLDVRDYRAVTGEILSRRPDLVLHLAAETDLEVSESNPDHAYATNTVGTHNVALAAEAVGATLVYISTAGIFDGTKTSGPYTEFDQPNPINVYGDSKFQGERVVEQTMSKYFVVRAGWMIGGHERDHKFVAKVLGQIRSGATTIRAVDDRLGTPTYTVDFAANLLELVQTPFHGLYHMVCGGDGSRLDVAREIVAHLGRTNVEVVPVTSDHFAAEYFAPRPRSEIMRNYQLDLRGLNRMRPWREALAAYLDSLDPALTGRDAERSA